MMNWTTITAIAGLVGLGATGVACSKEATAVPDAAPVASASATSSASAVPSAAAGNDGTDAKSPVLAPEDVGFKDTRKGMGWGDRCFTHFKAGKLGWARAACDAGLALPEVDVKARPPLLYNEGMIAKASGDLSAARGYFTQSLTLRGPDDPGRAEVEKELRSVGGTPPATTLPADAKLECKVKSAGGVVELFVRPATSVADATGVLRTTPADAGPPTLRAVKTELYKGLLVVHPADSNDLSNILATVVYDPKKTMQVGNGRHNEPSLPCE